MKNVSDEEMKKALELLILGIKVVKPGATNEECENFIINVANNLQLERLTNDTK